MRILVLGAGAIGGYFGARLVQAGGDVTFLVRERRAEQLRARGVVVRSPHGDFSVPARAVVGAADAGAIDLVLVACKAYDLESAIESIAPAVGASTCVLPLLNGVAHVERLVAAFGAARVAGGSCAIPATLAADGDVVHLGTFHSIVFGRLPATAADAQPKLEALRDLYAKTPVPVELADDMMTALWEKFVGLATLAAMTCLMRASVGDIASTDDGEALMAEAFDACTRTAAAAGHPPREVALQRFRAMLGDRASTLTASMLRDLEAGGRTEAAHIVGDMVRRARRRRRPGADARGVVPPAGGRADPRAQGRGERRRVRHRLSAAPGRAGARTAAHSPVADAHSCRSSRPGGVHMLHRAPRRAAACTTPATIASAPEGSAARSARRPYEHDNTGGTRSRQARASPAAARARTQSLASMQQQHGGVRGERTGALARVGRALARCGVVAATLHGALCAAQGTEHLRIVGGLGGVNQYTRHEEPFWTQQLRTLSGGRATAEIVPHDRAGIRGQEMLRLVQLGVVPFGTALLNLSAVLDAEIGAPDLAGLNPDIAALRRSIAAFRPHLEKTLRDRYGSELLAVYAYAAQVTFCAKPIAGLADLKDRRIRFSSATQADWVTALGGIPVQTQFNEIVANVKSGNVDCVITGAMSGNTLGLHEVTTHLHTMPVNWGVALFVANGSAWSALSKDLQELLRRELPKLEQAIWVEAENDTSNGIACNTGAPSCSGGRPGSMVAVRATPADNAKRQEILVRNVLPAYMKRCGARCSQVWNQTVGSASGVPLP